MYRIQNRQGYTLIETLVVLSIVVLLGIFTIQVPKYVREEVETELFVQTIKQQLYLAQQYALISGQEVTCTINQQSVFSTVPHAKPISVPEHIHVNAVNYRFAAFSGHAIQFQNAILKDKHYMYIVHVQFGKGVFWIEKIKI
ncbi:MULTISPECIES: competence type IV pilus minor pilin ComGD [unclassified Granulicatella]|uniref:competence type IV pilus minor pilin ComGD n=1 Tax=unclassified Granulicatella TaxID=2630493 RepID=UPI001431EF99|nr:MULTISPECIES: competence type IV pilus minor pilin ComGD [unclassified Granulicatella]MBF0780554.1 prepilin-type N-terminal cleavage/methylation domain-containing protein [Granulicatella sp. 19428wC4_WM01]